MDNVNNENEIVLSRDDFKDYERVMRRQEISELKDLKNPTCLIGEEVESKTYGKGVLLIVNNEQRIVEIMFRKVASKAFLFPEAFQLGLKFVDEGIQRKIEELIKNEQSRGFIGKHPYKYDPVEDTEYYKSIEEELDKLIKKKIGSGGYLGYCHLYWMKKKIILKEKYGIDWKSPSELNPRIMFD